MKTKTFFVTKNGLVSQHKVRKTDIAGCGVLYPDQKVVVYTKLGNKYYFNFEEVKVGTHQAKELVLLATGDEISKLDIVTDTSYTVSSS